MDCQDVLDQLAGYLDRESGEDLARAIEAHLGRCRDCRIEVDTLKRTIRLFYEADNRTLETPPRVAQQLHEALAAEYLRQQRPPRD